MLSKDFTVFIELVCTLAQCYQYLQYICEWNVFTDMRISDNEFHILLAV